MAQTLSALGTKALAQAAAIAASMAGGTTTAEVTAMSNFLINIGKFPSEADRKSTRLNSSHSAKSRMPSSA